MHVLTTADTVQIIYVPIKGGEKTPQITSCGLVDMGAWCIIQYGVHTQSMLAFHASFQQLSITIR